MERVQSLVRLVLFLVLTATGVIAAWYLFLAYPVSLVDLLGVLALLLVLPLVFKVSQSVVRSITETYNVAEIGVTGPITRDSRPGPIGSPPVGTAANAVVEQIDRANDDSSVRALLVRLNSPGGQIVPSEDIKLAVERFEGPTIGYATDTCASGGYEIASGCDELWAREASVVGSIGVIGSRVTAADLADTLGLEYEQLTAGEYKDAGIPLKDLEENERAYLQNLVDDFYEWFVSNVSERRDMRPEDIKETEARIYLGTEAEELGLVDEIGTREDVEDRLEVLLETTPKIRSFDPHLGLTQRLSLGAQRVAYAVGAGIVGSVRGDTHQFRFE